MHPENHLWLIHVKCPTFNSKLIQVACCFVMQQYLRDAVLCWVGVVQVFLEKLKREGYLGQGFSPFLGQLLRSSFEHMRVGIQLPELGELIKRQ